MNKNITKYLSLLCIAAISHSNFSMCRVAGPVLTQASVAMAAIAPKAILQFKNCTNSSENKSTENSSAQKHATSMNEQEFGKLFQEMLDQQKKQTSILDRMEEEQNNLMYFKWFFGIFTCFHIYSIGNNLSSIGTNLFLIRNDVSSMRKKLSSMESDSSSINSCLHDIKLKTK